ncbi:MAG: hypothetical protein QM742_08120 [Aquabacterium sp.]
MTVEGNVVVDASTGGYHLHYGRDLNVRNNLFVGGGKAEVSWGNPDKSGDWKLRGTATGRRSHARDVNVGNGSPEQAMRRMDQMGADFSLVDVTAPSGVTDVNVQGGDETNRALWTKVIHNAHKTLQGVVSRFGMDASQFRLPALAPAQVQPRADALRQTKGARVAAPAATAAKAPALSWQWDFTAMDTGAPAPDGLRALPERSPALISIEHDPVAASQDHCLMLRDGAPGIHRFEPYIFVKPSMDVIGSSVRFVIRLDGESDIIHEWRDAPTGMYKVLFSIGLSPVKGLVLGGRKLGQLPADKWLDVTIQAEEGSQPAVSIVIKSEEGKVYQWRRVQPLDANQPKVKWVGWISNGLQPANTCLKAISVQPPDKDRDD